MKPILNSLNESEVETFLKSPSHGLIISGQAGAGKRTLAVYMATQLLGKVTNPSASILEIDGAEEGIEGIRRIGSFLSLKTVGEAKIKRVVIVVSADEMRHEAQNALLKILEEPPEDTVIILLAQQSSDLLATVISRCRTLTVKPINKTQASSAFTGYSEVEINRAWIISGGFVGLLKSILENDEEQPLVVGISQAREVLRSPIDRRLILLEDYVKDKNFDLEIFLDGMYRLLHFALESAINKEVNNNEIKKMQERCRLVSRSKKYALNRVQSKLILTRLFYSL